MGRRSNRKNAQDLPATCVVVPNFELEPSEGEDWEGYPEVRVASVDFLKLFVV